ncbi:cytochrome c [Meinhardsimonia xiamenensis]|jgi:cytochrome c|uniref:Cytochrome c n=1 Tax=Meinhardsimonia xiamenensis TaxID=990712 RepID=A0A1G8Z9P7_9RHOB|nr:c-type cytochrome [Meinhardsimonia xiamenensis]PRX37610.1 cytochrome c [Meinhardsimonia xiamenensis]SDK11737.1 cytochrome c [Meinhardsimonia xiamenensis]
MKSTIAIIAAALLAAPALADGNPAEGEKVFKKCISCHVVADPDGNVLAGRGAKTGPNLYGIAGRVVGSEEGFRYSDGLKALGEQGVVWDEEHFIAFVQDPTGWLKDQLGDSKARSKMSFKVRKEDEARDVYAYLAQFGAQ